MVFFFLNALQLIVMGFLLLFYFESVKLQERRGKTDATHSNKPRIVA